MSVASGLWSLAQQDFVSCSLLSRVSTVGGMVVRPEYGVGQQSVVGRRPALPQDLAVAPEPPELASTGQLCLVTIHRHPLPALHHLQSGQLRPCGLKFSIRTFGLGRRALVPL